MRFLIVFLLLLSSCGPNSIGKYVKEDYKFTIIEVGEARYGHKYVVTSTGWKLWLYSYSLADFYKGKIGQENCYTVKYYTDSYTDGPNDGTLMGLCAQKEKREDVL
jgi:hypothetical protein